jgi:hypothetical protein
MFFECRVAFSNSEFNALLKKGRRREISVQSLARARRVNLWRHPQ